ncbi:MAG TPA: class I SAM-dependent methyltransferase [Vicinamibacterales bacterium]|nr:class I SAM-dependent methyltransferase [Vicinamibacterales bacterium]
MTARRPRRPSLLRFAAVALSILLGATTLAAQHARLFPPEELGLLEGPDRDVWQQPDRIMDALGIGDGSVVADLGAGSGWFTIRLARRVGPNGVVYAEDIQRQMIEAVDRRVQREGLRNVRTVLGTARDPHLPDGSIDAVLMVDTYWEVEQPIELLRKIDRSLKPGGRIGIVDFKRDGGGPGPAMDERSDPGRAIEDARAAGLDLLSRETFLRYQYMLVFGHAPGHRR